jgi:predicted aconitase with swiveling domain
MTERVFKGHAGIGPAVTGPALVATDNFSARYDLDRINGTFSRPSHRLFGQSYLGKILVLNIAKGGVATAWMLYEMAARGKAPLALVLNYANPIMAQGAAHADFPLIDRFACDITGAIRTGETVTVEPSAGLVTVHD